MEKIKITIIGLGYVGLPLALEINKNCRFEVFGYDIDEKVISNIKEFPVNSDPRILKNSKIFIICVPTPIKSDFQPDLKPIKSASELVSKYLQKGNSVVIESTVNPGVCEEVVLPLLEKSGLKGGKDFELSHCPERINPGDPKWDVSNIPRNIGSLTKEGNKKIADFYRTFLKAEINEVSSLKIAEATKIIENTFRDINIAYVNELAKSFDMLGIDLIEVINAASNKPFAFMPHYPGCGVGGHCIPVDPYYLIERAAVYGFEHSFLKKAREVNNSMPEYTVSLLEKKLINTGKTLKNSKIGLLGLAYKAD
ncbi:nucleotide sugar dehydrogenase, partial [Candidatus Peregrinibacteria bacterium]|nr:nucleotide sugar dehydrogenase [Candidatus Peregrinibacteria bacterium]